MGWFVFRVLRLARTARWSTRRKFSIPCWILDGYEITSGGVLVFKGLKDHRFNNFVKEISE